MDNNRFYFIKGSGATKYYHACEDLSYTGCSEKVCDKCGRTVSMFVYSQKPHHFIIKDGKEYPDYLQFWGVGEIPVIFSERTIDVFLKNNITGFTISEKVEISKKAYGKIKSVNDAPTYYYVNVIGEVDYNYKEMFLKKKNFCPVCGQFNLNRQRLYPTFIDANTWNGCDVCSLTTFPRRKVCTERVRRIVVDNKLLGFDFEVLK